jgi:hypothetical protein
MTTPGLLLGAGRALDAYSIRARWAPVLLVVLPPLTLCFALVPGLPAWYKMWPLLGVTAIVVLVDQLGREGGRRLQPELWASWGGAPTTAALRHRDAANPILLARQHERIAGIIGHALPTADEERADPIGADHVYQAAIAVLIARTRGRRQEYPLIFSENCNYGFRRNMLGLRRWGMLLATVTGILALAAIAISLAGLVPLPLAPSGVTLVTSVAAATIWWLVVTPGWVLAVAKAYAERLIEAAETLGKAAEQPG